jgi:hypothetical protein
MDNLKAVIREYVFSRKTENVKKVLPNYLKCYLVDLITKGYSEVSLLKSLILSQGTNREIVVCKKIDFSCQKTKYYRSGTRQHTVCWLAR